MKCPKFNTTEVSKNGHRRGRQCYKCKHCDRQFLEDYRPWQYSNDVKQLCLKMYLNGRGHRGIERATEIHHTTILHWVREAGLSLPDVLPCLRRLLKSRILMNSRPMSAISVTSYGFGLLLTTNRQVFWPDNWRSQ
jgi:transposase-like protein